MTNRSIIQPSRREFLGGLVLLVILAGISMSRFGMPERGYAESTLIKQQVEEANVTRDSEDETSENLELGR